MDYEKLHKKTLAALQQRVSEGKITEEVARSICADFVKESEDERIRKEIIKTFKALGDGKIPVDINYADIFTWLEKQGEQKSAWSDEDEEIYKKVKTAIDSYYAPFSKDAEEMSEWFKSLKGRVQPQPKQDWSEEDEKMLQNTLSTIRYALAIPIDKENEPGFVGSSTISWLKSLKERMKGE